MKNLYHTFRCQSILLKAIFFMLLTSANASLTLQYVKRSMEPGYHCHNKLYSFGEIEKVRKLACKAFLSTRDDARRPIVRQEYINVENLIYEWSLPANPTINPTIHPTDQTRKYTGKIIFNNRCELIDVACYERKTKQEYLCQKVSKVSSSTTSGDDKVLEEPFVQCGSLALKTEEIREYARSKSFDSLLEFHEVRETLGRIDGPWKRALFSKELIIRHRSNDILYEIVVDKHDEVRGMVVTHHISRKLTSAEAHDGEIIKGPRKAKLKKHTIRLVCFFHKTFPLLRPALISDVSNPLKRKALV
ncbi:CSEP0418 putative effector protein [Blumeria hordei DH14]|uniref:CSEP0418 putative effector protein n=1 Tax=Blumeria graminis f. sp. hordei (strain DH14) TaxID=546991 RepID=A0A078MYQ1_BLUG1|nr:CSEP0418 putative effector protein [Blumeria hordei DH14]